MRKFDFFKIYIFQFMNMKFFNKPCSFTSNDYKNYLVEQGLLSKKACYCGRLDPNGKRNNVIFRR